MRVNQININFNAQYRTMTNNTPKQISEMYNSKISQKRDEVLKQKDVVDKEVEKFNSMQKELLQLSQSRKMTLNALQYMSKRRVQSTIDALPKQDTIVLFTPDVGNNLTDFPYLSYVEGKKGLFSKTTQFPNENFKTCFFDDENNEFNPNLIDNWFKVLGGKI